VTAAEKAGRGATGRSTREWAAALAGASLILIWSIVNVVQAVVTLAGAHTRADAEVTAPDLPPEITAALGEGPDIEFFAFADTVASPFRSRRHVVRTARRTGGTPAPPPVELKLKGILVKDSPLAIVEEPSGKTHICKKGDRVLEQLVVDITEDEVVLAHRGRRYRLRTSEQ